jgi:hypothetical protein
LDYPLCLFPAVLWIWNFSFFGFESRFWSLFCIRI